MPESGGSDIPVTIQVMTLTDYDSVSRLLTSIPGLTMRSADSREAIERYFPSDFDCMLEKEPLNGLASDGELAAYEHRGFWQCVDTPRERMLLGDLWESGEAPWQTWE